MGKDDLDLNGKKYLQQSKQTTSDTEYFHWLLGPEFRHATGVQ